MAMIDYGRLDTFAHPDVPGRCSRLQIIIRHSFAFVRRWRGEGGGPEKQVAGMFILKCVW